MKSLIIGALGAVLMAGSAHANLIVNGSFETSPIDPGSFTTVNAGSNVITGWTVGGNVDYIGSYWQASDGQRSIDLDGTKMGSLTQTFATTAGKQYLISFDLAGNPDTKTTKQERVTVGILQNNYSFSTALTNKTTMGWTPQSFLFTATGSSATLKFASLTSGSYGAALDHVNVAAVPLPASLPMFGGALLALAGIVAVSRRKTSGSADLVALPA